MGGACAKGRAGQIVIDFTLLVMLPEVFDGCVGVQCDPMATKDRSLDVPKSLRTLQHFYPLPAPRTVAPSPPSPSYPQQHPEPLRGHSTKSYLPQKPHLSVESVEYRSHAFEFDSPVGGIASLVPSICGSVAVAETNSRGLQEAIDTCTCRESSALFWSIHRYFRESPFPAVPDLSCPSASNSRLIFSHISSSAPLLPAVGACAGP